jgi:hypothetical protein
VIKVSLGFTESNAVLFAAHHYLQYTGGPASAADLTTLAGQAENGFVGFLKSHTPTDVTLTSVTTQDLSSDHGFVSLLPTSDAGTDASPSPESGVATIVNFHIGRHYRGGHPKCFMPGGSNAQVLEPGRWLSTYTGAYASGFQNMVNAEVNHTYATLAMVGQVAVSWFHGPTSNTDPSVWAPKNKPAARTTPVVDAVTSITVNSLIGSQRRRRTSTGA